MEVYNQSRGSTVGECLSNIGECESCDGLRLAKFRVDSASTFYHKLEKK